MVLSSIFLYVYAIVHVYFLEVCKLFMYGIGMTGGHLFYITYWATKAAAAHQRRQAVYPSIEPKLFLKKKRKQTERPSPSRGSSPSRLPSLSRRPLPLASASTSSPPALPRTTRPDDARFRRIAAIFPVTGPRTPPPIPLVHKGYIFLVNTILGCERLAGAALTPPR
jgi:hypothetical protein